MGKGNPFQTLSEHIYRMAERELRLASRAIDRLPPDASREELFARSGRYRRALARWRALETFRLRWN